jgi:hypothetical protein
MGLFIYVAHYYDLDQVNVLTPTWQDQRKSLMLEATSYFYLKI